MFGRPPRIERARRGRGPNPPPPPRRPSGRQLSRLQRERSQRRTLFAAIGAAAVLVVAVLGFGVYREFVGYPGEPVAYAFGQPISLRTFTDSLSEEMRRLQTQTGSGLRDETNPGAASSQIQRLIGAQETLPEDVLETEIEKALIRQEARTRGLNVSEDEIGAKINEFLAVQRAVFNRPTSTPTLTQTPRPTATETPEGFAPTATPTRTPTGSPTVTPTPTGSPTATPTPSPTTDPDASPTPTNTPRPTRTPVVTPTVPPTLEPTEFERAYGDLRGALRSEAKYRHDVEDQLLRTKLRDTIGAAAPTAGPRARVLRLVTSTIDEAKVALISLRGGFSTFEELVEQTSDRPAEGRESGNLGWVAKGAETREFDDVVLSPLTPLGDWTEPFAAGHHFEIVHVLERESDGPYDQKNVEKIKDRLFREWLDQAEASSEITRDLSPQERQWAVDRASRGIFTTETPRR